MRNDLESLGSWPMDEVMARPERQRGIVTAAEAAAGTDAEKLLADAGLADDEAVAVFSRGRIWRSRDAVLCEIQFNSQEMTISSDGRPDVVVPFASTRIEATMKSLRFELNDEWWRLDFLDHVENRAGKATTALAAAAVAVAGAAGAGLGMAGRNQAHYGRIFHLEARGFHRLYRQVEQAAPSFSPARHRWSRRIFRAFLFGVLSYMGLALIAVALITIAIPAVILGEGMFQVIDDGPQMRDVFELNAVVVLAALVPSILFLPAAAMHRVVFLTWAESSSDPLTRASSGFSTFRVGLRLCFVGRPLWLDLPVIVLMPILGIAKVVLSRNGGDDALLLIVDQVWMSLGALFALGAMAWVAYLDRHCVFTGSVLFQRYVVPENSLARWDVVRPIAIATLVAVVVSWLFALAVWMFFS